MNVFWLCLKFIFTNLVFSLAVFLFFLSVRKRYKYGICTIELLLYSLGAGPAIMTILLYYLLMFFPSHSSIFYVLSVFLSFFGVGLIGKKCLPDFVKEIQVWIESIKKIDLSCRCNFISISVVILLIIMWFISFLYGPTTNNDSFQYGIRGKEFFTNKQIKYYVYHYNEKTGFQDTSLHGFSFPLLTTWEELINDVFHSEGDLYVRSIRGYYWMLLFFILAYWLKRINKKLFIYGAIAYAAIPGVYRMLVDWPIDSYRIYFFVIAIIFLLYSIKGENKFSLIMFGLFAGLASNIHSVSALLMVFYIPIMFLFLRGNILNRIKTILPSLVLVLLFGGVHYPMDVLYGSGWVFPKVVCRTCDDFSLSGDKSTLVGELEKNLLKNKFTVDEKRRGLGSSYKYLFGGYLGQFFRFDMVGLFNWLIIPCVFLLLKGRKRFTRLEWCFVFIYVISLLAISLKGYRNFRYHMTLIPISSFIIFYILDKYNLFKKYTGILLVLLVTSILYCVYWQISIRGIREFLDGLSTGYIKGEEYHMRNITNFVDRLLTESKNNETLISNGYYFVFYYGKGIKTLYCWAGYSVCYDSDGIKNIFEELNSNRFSYILSSEDHNEYNPEFADFVSSRAKEIYRSGDYIIYEIVR